MGGRHQDRAGPAAQGAGRGRPRRRRGRPGEMWTDMLRNALPDDDISGEPPSEEVASAAVRLLTERLPVSGRYRAADAGR